MVLFFFLLLSNSSNLPYCILTEICHCFLYLFTNLLLGHVHVIYWLYIYIYIIWSLFTKKYIIWSLNYSLAPFYTCNNMDIVLEYLRKYWVQMYVICLVTVGLLHNNDIKVIWNGFSLWFEPISSPDLLEECWWWAKWELEISDSCLVSS